MTYPAAYLLLVPCSIPRQDKSFRLFMVGRCPQPMISRGIVYHIMIFYVVIYIYSYMSYIIYLNNCFPVYIIFSLYIRYNILLNITLLYES